MAVKLMEKHIPCIQSYSKIYNTDGITLQKWLIGAGTITDGQAGDFDGNQRLNGIDLIFMRRKLLEIIRKSRFVRWCDKTAFVMLSA